MNRLKIFRSIAIDALFLALFILFTFVPWLGYYQVGPISFQIVHIFVLIGAAIFGWKKGLLYGFIFGLLSLIKAASFPGTLDFAFLNPFVSILPRALFGFVAGFVFDIIKKHATLKQFMISCMASFAIGATNSKPFSQVMYMSLIFCIGRTFHNKKYSKNVFFVNKRRNKKERRYKTRALEFFALSD